MCHWKTLRFFAAFRCCWWYSRCVPVNVYRVYGICTTFSCVLLCLMEMALCLMICLYYFFFDIHSVDTWQTEQESERTSTPRPTNSKSRHRKWRRKKPSRLVAFEFYVLNATGDLHSAISEYCVDSFFAPFFLFRQLTLRFFSLWFVSAVVFILYVERI